MGDESAIRALSLEWGNKKVKSLLISNQGRDGYTLIHKNKELTSSEFSAAKGISVQHASVVLARIYRQGYVGRYQRIADTGGAEWVYTI